MWGPFQKLLVLRVPSEFGVSEGGLCCAPRCPVLGCLRRPQPSVFGKLLNQIVDSSEKPCGMFGSGLRTHVWGWKVTSLLATPRLPVSDHRGFLPLPPLAAVLLLTRGLCRAGLARSPACAPHHRRRPLADAHKRGPVSYTDVTSRTTRASGQSRCLNVGISCCLGDRACGPLRCIPSRLCARHRLLARLHAHAAACCVPGTALSTPGVQGHGLRPVPFIGQSTCPLSCCRGLLSGRVWVSASGP